MKKTMITRLFFSFAHVASIKHLPTPLSKLILSQNLDPSCLPSKEADSKKSPKVPNYTMREKICSPLAKEE